MGGSFSGFTLRGRQPPLPYRNYKANIVLVSSILSKNLGETRKKFEFPQNPHRIPAPQSFGLAERRPLQQRAQVGGPAKPAAGLFLLLVLGGRSRGGIAGRERLADRREADGDRHLGNAGRTADRDLLCGGGPRGAVGTGRMGRILVRHSMSPYRTL